MAERSSSSISLWRGAAPRVAISLLLAGGFVWLLARGGLPLVPPKEALLRLPGSTLVEYIALMAVTTVLRTYRWNFLIRPIAPEARPLRIMGMSMVGFSAIFLLPLRSGEVVRPYLVARDGQVTFMQAAGTVGAERVIDGLVLTSLTFIALSLATPVSPLPSSLGDLPLPVAAVPAAVYSALLVFGGAFLVMTAFYFARVPARRLTKSVLGVISPRFGDWAAATLERIADGLSFLPSKGHLVRFLAATLGCWFLGILAQWVLLLGLGLDATLAQATTTVGVQGLGTLVPAGPGMFGAYQIAGFSALAMFFPMAQVKVEGAIFIFVAYTANLLFNALQLLVGFAIMAKTRPAPNELRDRAH
jgi:glycosyltransferase 2 family protein